MQSYTTTYTTDSNPGREMEYRTMANSAEEARQQFEDYARNGRADNCQEVRTEETQY